jgi:O-antigen ligase/Tfp pilus assembly protein PilF
MTKVRKKSAKTSTKPMLAAASYAQTQPGALWTCQMNWWIALVAMLPFLFRRGIMHVTELPRFTVLSAFLLLFLLRFYCFPGNARRQQPFHLLTRVTAAFSAGFLVMLVISATGSFNKQESLEFILRYLLAVIVTILFAFSLSSEFSSLLRLCKVLTIVLAAQALIGILQFYGLGFTQLPPIKDDVPYGLMGHRNLLSSAIALMLPFAGYVACTGGRNWKIASAISLWLAVYCLILGQTRSAWLAAMASVLSANVLVFALRHSFPGVFLKGWVKGMALFCAGTFLAAAMALFIPARSGFSRNLKEKAISVASVSEEGTSVGTGRWRFVAWQLAATIMAKHPLLGVGPGNWRIVAPGYGFFPLLFQGKPVAAPDHVHNLYLQVGAETGVPGLLLYLGIWASAGVMAFRAFQRSVHPGQRIAALMAVAGLCAYAADSVFSFPDDSITHLLLLGLFLGVAAAVYEQTPGHKPDQFLRVRYGYAVPVVLVLCLGLWVGYARMKFEFHDLLARAYLDGQPAAALEEARSGTSPLVTISHYGEPLEFWMALAFLNLGDFQDALSTMQRAENLNPWHVDTFCNKATIYLKMGRIDGAIQSYQAALRLAPSYDVAALQLGSAYYRKRMYKEACESFVKALPFADENYYALLGSAYMQDQLPQKAASVLREGLQKFPDGTNVLETLAAIEYMQLQDFTNAYIHFKTLLTLQPDHPKRNEYIPVINYCEQRLGKDSATGKPSKVP